MSFLLLFKCIHLRWRTDYLNNVDKTLGDGELVEWISQHSVDPRRAELRL